MAPVLGKALGVFKRWGQKGGEKRAKGLPASRRQAIARHAAQVRWRGEGGDIMQSVRLNEPLWGDPVYLEEILLYGGLKEWKEIRRMLADHPFGACAVSLQKVLRATHIYGTTSLWNGILRNLQGTNL